MMSETRLLEAMTVAAYMTDACGRITFYNEAAASLWGRRPKPGDRWCGARRLYWADGRPMLHAHCPVAVLLEGGQPAAETEVVVERPDGTSRWCKSYPSLLKDGSGSVIGAINVLFDTTLQKDEENAAAQLAAIVSGSDDAIVSKRLDGQVVTWNEGAKRLFGYDAHEMIGQSITRLIPPDLLGEERTIIAKLKRGERIEHFDTVRVARDGQRIHVSLTVSPVYDKSGNVIGASKVARDITERKQTEELQVLLFHELNHRVKNTLATVQAIASQSLRRSASPEDFVSSFNGRIQALARAHDLLVKTKLKGAALSEIIREQVLLGSTGGPRFSSSGPFVMLDSRAAMQLGLVLHELATNARKYGAFSVESGHLALDWKIHTSPERVLLITWSETGVPNVSAPSRHGFGSILIERTLEAHGGKAEIHYGIDGITCEISLPLLDEEEQAFEWARAPAHQPASSTSLLERECAALRGKRILIVDDEPLVAMEIESELNALGCMPVGPAGTLEAAGQLIAATPIDAALLDANLGRGPVDEIAVALQQKAIPFAFVTGYGRDALPHAFQDTATLTKPVNSEQLRAVLETVLGIARRTPPR